MRKAFLIVLLLALQAVVQAQTVTPAFQFTTQTDSVATVMSYVAGLKLGPAAMTQVTLTCVPNGQGAQCTVPLVGFDQTKPVAITVSLTSPSNGLTTQSTLNYVPGQPPGAFVLVPAWKVTIP